MADRDRKPTGGTDGGREQSAEPLLTIGIIFRNEIRCIRRCLDSLRPLREAVPCELIMADTGSTDGSRAVAAEYADELFDFPWVDDFAAARNAVLDRASGIWYLTIDCDEWLDPDIQELAEYLPDGEFRLVAVTQRNYKTWNLNGPYSDFWAARLFQRTDGVRFQGALHELVVFRTPDDGPVPALERTILHHDGYVRTYQGSGFAKNCRNLRAARREVEDTPQSLRALDHFLSFGKNEPEYRDLLERAMGLSEAKAPGWDIYGGKIFRDALYNAWSKGFPELETWAKRGEAMAPDSFLLRVDGNFFLGSHAAEKEDWPEVLRRETEYLAALGEKADNPWWERERRITALFRDRPDWVQEGRIQLARALAHTGQTDRALELLAELRGEDMKERQIPLGEALLLNLSGAADADLLRRLAVETGAGSKQAASWAAVLIRAADREAEREAVRKTNQQADRGANQQTDRGTAAAQAPVPAELLQLAEQVRTILSAYPPDNPAVLELKRSPVYQRVSRFIEEA